MPPTALKWLASIVFGLLIGSASFGITNPLLQVVFGLNPPAGEPYVPLDPIALERMQIAGAVLYGVIAVVAAVVLAYGYALGYLGGGLLLTIVGAVLVRKNRDKPAA